MGHRPVLSAAEAEVVRVLWEQGPSTVRQIKAVLEQRGGRRAYTTVLTLLQRLQAKGHVASEPVEGESAYRYRALVTLEEMLTLGLENLAERYCPGESNRLAMALVKGRALSAEDIAELRRLLDELDPKPARPSSRTARRHPKC